MTRASLDKSPSDVAAMFDGVARRYDRTNSVLSLGLDAHWRREVRRALQLRPGERVLDLAAGTAVSSEELARSGACVVAADFSLGMLSVARQRVATAPLLPVFPVAADALCLPFRDAAFDAVTISFGLRNVADVDAALRELARVTRPGGRLLVCEFSSPVLPGWRTIYLQYLMRALPSIARAVASNPDAYVYLAESIRAWPAQPELAERIEAAGWRDTAWRNLTGGVVALHRAVRDAGAQGVVAR
jgi:demethylmenaquinone methyltransferase/2-methoxy-6-polyprenyl-1,4-benzoquinol methylase